MFTEDHRRHAAQVARYIFVGVVSYLLEVLILLFLVHQGASRTVAVAISFWFGLVFSFLLQRAFAFRSKGVSRMAPQLLLYVGLVFFNYVFTIMFVATTTGTVPVLTARTVALVMTTAWNFLLYRQLIFADSLKFSFRIRGTREQWLKRAGWALLSLPVIIAPWGSLAAGKDAVLRGDYDMLVQMTQAARISIVEYHQFPLWNPWTAGGVPLYADPQFGFLTPQMLLALVIGPELGWRITTVLYLLASFYGMLHLLRRWKGGRAVFAVHVLLAYCWACGGFLIIRSLGHNNFVIFGLLPILILAYLGLNRGLWRVVAMIVLLAFLLTVCIHYPLILLLQVVFLMAAVEAVISAGGVVSWARTGFRAAAKSLVFSRPVLLVVAFVSAVVITLPRVLLTFDYVGSARAEHSFPPPEPFLGWSMGFQQIARSVHQVELPPNAIWGAYEGNTYIGLWTVVGCAVLAVAVLALTVSRRISWRYEGARDDVLVLVAAIVIGVYGYVLGSGGELFETFRTLPGMSNTRVAPRMFVLTAFAVLLLTGLLAHWVAARGLKVTTGLTWVVAAMLVVSAVQVWLVGWQDTRRIWDEVAVRSAPPVAIDRSRPPTPVKVAKPYSRTSTTWNNEDQVVTDNALVPTFLVGTTLCSVDEPIEGRCSFVPSQNGEVKDWTPNRFTIRRTGPGDILVNMNADHGWVVNGQRYSHPRVADPMNAMVLHGTQAEYLLEYRPSLLPLD